MGVSTDGQLTFGWPLKNEHGDDDELSLSDLFIGFDDERDEEFDEYIKRLAGVPEIPEDYESESEEDRDKRWALGKKAVDECPVQLVMHCSYDYPMYILAPNFPGSTLINHRGFPLKITRLNILPTPLRRAKLRRAKAWASEHCKHPLTEEPAWWLTSLWG